MIEFGWFQSHSKFQLPWKIDCDDLTDNDIEAIAKLIQWKFAFGGVYGIPQGGLRLQKALEKYTTSEYPLLIVDDVLTTGNSMNEAKLKLATPNAIGVVIFSRGICPNWIWSIFNVNEWAQSRATGLG